MIPLTTIALWMHDHHDAANYFSRLIEPTVIRFVNATARSHYAFHYFAIEIDEIPWCMAPGQDELLPEALSDVA